MIANKQITRSNERMRTQIDWLDGWHSFSFGGHYDPERMGFGALRVVNDDRIVPGGGFAPHPHANMEIVTLVLEGQIEHQDSMGHGRVINAGEVQYMSAGSGVTHSEFNPSSQHATHLMQVWIEPNEKGLEPRYADQPIVGEVDNAWKLILSADGRDGSIAIRQDAELRSARLEPQAMLSYTPQALLRGLWLFVLNGSVELAGESLETADSIALSGFVELSVRNRGSTEARVILFDLPL